MTGNVIYEVVYSEVIDNLVNNDWRKCRQTSSITISDQCQDSTEIDSVYPNSLQNMRDQVIDVVGQSAMCCLDGC
jgi:hypothetical protein